MPFVYRLQKILDFRIRKKEQQLLEVQRAQKELAIVDQQILANKQEIANLVENQRHADPMMMDSYDKYIHHLWEKAEELQKLRVEKQQKVDEEVQKLIECEKEVKVLEKHKEKNKEQYKEEEKKAELNQLSEIGVQRHFMHKRETQEEEALLEEIIKKYKFESENQ